MNTTGPTGTTPTFDGVPLQLTPHTMIDLGDACPIGYGADILAGRYEVGEWIECPDCGQEHDIVAAVPVAVVENLTVVH